MAELYNKPGPVVHVHGPDAFMIEILGCRVLVDNGPFVNLDNEVPHFTCVLNSAPTETFLANAAKRNQSSFVPVVGSCVSKELKKNLEERGVPVVVTKQTPDYKPCIMHKDLSGRFELFVLDGGLPASLGTLRQNLEKGDMASVERLAIANGMIFAMAWFPTDETQLVRRILYTGKASTERVIMALEKASCLKLFQVPSVTSAQAAAGIELSPRVRPVPASRGGNQPAGRSTATTSRSTTPKGPVPSARTTAARLSTPGGTKAAVARPQPARLSSAARVPASSKAPLMPMKTGALVPGRPNGIPPKPALPRTVAGPSRLPPVPKAPAAGNLKNAPKSPAGASRTVAAVKEEAKPVVVKTEPVEERPPIEVITIPDSPQRDISVVVLDETVVAADNSILAEEHPQAVAAPDVEPVAVTPSSPPAPLPIEITPEISETVRQLLNNVSGQQDIAEENIGMAVNDTLKSLVEGVIRQLEVQPALDVTLPVEISGEWRNVQPNAPVGILNMPVMNKNAVPPKPRLRREVFFELVTVPHNGQECSFGSAEEAKEFFASVRSRNYIMACDNLEKHMLEGMLEGKKSWLQPTHEVNVYPTTCPQLMADFLAENKEQMGAEALVIKDAAAVQKLYI